jgi:hypothetical protein
MRLKKEMVDKAFFWRKSGIQFYNIHSGDVNLFQFMKYISGWEVFKSEGMPYYNPDSVDSTFLFKCLIAADFFFTCQNDCSNLIDDSHSDFKLIELIEVAQGGNIFDFFSENTDQFYQFFESKIEALKEHCSALALENADRGVYQYEEDFEFKSGKNDGMVGV